MIESERIAGLVLGNMSREEKDAFIIADLVQLFLRDREAMYNALNGLPD